MIRFHHVFSTNTIGLAVAAIVGVVAPCTVEAQAIWMRPLLGRGTSIEALKVDYSQPQGLSTFSLVLYAGTSIRVGRDLQLVGELPYATAKEDGFPFSRTAIGNPYLGVEWGQSDALVWEFGVRLPIGDDPSFNGAATLGLGSDAPDRLEAWAARAFSLQLTPNLIHRNRDGLVFRVRAGPSLFAPSGIASSGADLILAYGGQIGYEGDLVKLLGGVSGRTVATSDGATFNHVVASVAFDLGGFRPVATLRIPFGDIDGVDAVYGVGFVLGF